MKFDATSYRLLDDGGLARKALAVGIVGLAASALLAIYDIEHLLQSYLASLLYWLTISLGAFFFVMLHHLTNSTWSVVLRRLAEKTAALIPVLAVLFLPVLAGMRLIYPWSNDSLTAADELIRHKSPYLNAPFFVARAVFYFAAWIVVSRLLLRLSILQDSGDDPEITRKFRAVSAPGIPLFAVTITFAAFDWVMSLDPHWYSTIFGVYLFSGSLLAGLSFLTFMVIYFQGKGVLDKAVTVEHFNDLGRLLFAFTVFWAYIAFSQFFLIWYANIPEETIWFSHRWHGSWKYFSLIIVFGHFVLPFLALISNPAKRSRTVLGIVAVWLLFVHWVDIYWLIMPNFAEHGGRVTLFDFCSWIGIGGTIIWRLLQSLKAAPLVPVGDARLESSLKITTG